MESMDHLKKAAIKVGVVTQKKKEAGTKNLDVLWIRQQHSYPIDAHSPATSRRQAILKCCTKRFIQSHCFIITRLPVLLKKTKYNRIQQIVNQLTKSSFRFLGVITQTTGGCVFITGYDTLSCSANRWRCTTGSFNSVYALHTWIVIKC